MDHPASQVSEASFDAMVSGFYRAATGACSWDDALLPVQQAFGARAAVLHPWSLTDGSTLSLHAAGGPNLSQCLLDYVGGYHLIDPRKQITLELGAAAAGQWLHCHDRLSEAYMAQDPFCQNFMVAYESRYNTNVSMPINEQLMIGFGLELPAPRGPLDTDERELARRLGLHLHDALMAYERVRRLVQQSLAGHELLQRYP